MKIIKSSVLIVIFIALLVSVSAQENKSSASPSQNEAFLNTEISFDYATSIPTKLSFDVKSERKKIWLGVSLYPATFSDPMKDGEHFQIELNGDRTGKVVKVGKKFSGGSFEAAVWGKKVLKSECAIDNCYWCAKNGFHLDELLFYTSGSLQYSH